MSIDAYKIAVKIALVQNVTDGLTALSRHFIATGKNAEELEARLKSIGKLTLLGGGALAAGGWGLKLFDQPLQKSIEYERQLARLRQQGLGDHQIEEARKFADAQKVIGQSRLDMIRHFTEAQGSFRESGMDGAHALDAAKIMAPLLGTYESASDMLSGHSKAAAHQSMQNLNKTVELMGGLNDPERAKGLVNGVFKAVQSSGRMIDERQLKQFFARGGSATNSIDPRDLFGGLEPLLGELGGEQTATGLQTAFNRMSGTMAMPPKKMQGMLTSLGIGVKNQFGQVELKHDLLELMQKSPTEFAAKMLDVYAANGINSVLDRERMNNVLFSRTGARTYNQIMRQMPVIERSKAAYDKSLTPEEILNTPEGKRLALLKDYEAKKENLQLVLGEKVLPLAIWGLEKLIGLLERITTFAQEWPTLTKVLAVGTAVASGLAVAFGSLLMGFSVLRGFGVLWDFTRLGAAFNAAKKITKLGPTVGKAISKAIALGRAAVSRASVLLRAGVSKIANGFRLAGQVLARAWPIVRVAMSAIGRVFLSVGRVLLANPIVLVIAAIGVAAFLLWKHWGTIKPKLLEIWANIKTKALELWENLKTGFYQFVHFGLDSFQSFFNALIDGINVLLPKAKEFSRVTFADDYAKAHLPPQQGDSPYIAPNNGQTIRLSTTIPLDGRVLAHVVSEHQAREANRPGMGAPNHDPIMGAPPVGLGYSGSW